MTALTSLLEGDSEEVVRSTVALPNDQLQSLAHQLIEALISRSQTPLTRSNAAFALNAIASRVLIEAHLAKSIANALVALEKEQDEDIRRAGLAAFSSLAHSAELDHDTAENLLHAFETTESELESPWESRFIRAAVTELTKRLNAIQPDSQTEQNARPISLTGTFFPHLSSVQKYTSEECDCIRNTVGRLSSVETSAARPGMLLGQIQSGKTRAFLGVTALAFDNGFDIAIILTKGTKALAKQTLARVRDDFSYFLRSDQLQLFDIMTVPASLTRYELDQKLIFVSKKQADNLARLKNLFGSEYPQLASKRALIIDDEADYASIGFRRTRQEGLIANTTTHQIDGIRTLMSSSAFLQVTATPYSLYLQPENLTLRDFEFRPVKPAFTQLLPVSPLYVGGDYYFELGRTHITPASFLYEPVTSDELTVLRQSDERRFRLRESLTSKAIGTLRTAISNFVIGAVIRRIQDKQAGIPVKKFSFLVHTESQRAAHAWQEKVVFGLIDQLTKAASSSPQILRDLFEKSHSDLENSIKSKDLYLPSKAEVAAAGVTALQEGWVMISKVNSERQVEELLDEQGQLRLRTPLNIFIGGQILDRGITIANLIGFYYGRRPNVFQQDTVLQHSRMYGFRPMEDLAVTRFYTEPQIYEAMRRMYESDSALRGGLWLNNKQPVVFIQKDDAGKIIPCSPNKILVSKTTTLRPFKRLLPVGFHADAAVRTRPIVQKLDRRLAKLNPSESFEAPFEVTVNEAEIILEDIEPTLVMEVDEGYDFDWDAAKAAIVYMSNASRDLTKRGKVLCLVRNDRNLTRLMRNGVRSTYSDAPDTTHVEGRIAREYARSIPMLMLFRQNGTIEQGWSGTPFYWPVIWAPGELKTTIFAHETT